MIKIKLIINGYIYRIAYYSKQSKMKRKFLLILFLSLASMVSFAQDNSYKPKKVKADQKKTRQKDSTLVDEKIAVSEESKPIKKNSKKKTYSNNKNEYLDEK